MKKYLLLLTFLGLLSGGIAQTSFINVYDSAKMTYPRDVVFNEVGDIFVCTMAWEWNDYHYNNSIYKFDKNGNLLKTWWEKDTSRYKVEFTRLMMVDNELYLFGTIGTNSPTQENPAVFMKKFDQEFNEISFSKYFLDGEQHQGFYHVGRVKEHNDNFVFFSSVYSTDTDSIVTPFYMEISKEGELIKTVFDRESIQKHYCSDFLFKSENNGFLTLVTERDAFNVFYGYIYDYDCNLENLVKYPLEYGFGQFFTVLQEDDDVFYLSGSNWTIENNKQVGVMKLTNKGNVLNRYLFNPPSDSLSYTAYYNSLDRLSDGSIIMCSSYGIIGQFVPQYAQSWISLFKLSPDLELIWHRYIGGGANYEAYSMRVAPDDGIVICAGYSPVPPTSLLIKDLMIIKTDSDGQTVGLNDQNHGISTTEAILYPTPAQDFITVDFSLLHKTATLKLMDLACRTILERALTSNHQQVDISGVSPGAYVYRIYNSKGLEESGKLVVE